MDGCDGRSDINKEYLLYLYVRSELLKQYRFVLYSDADDILMVALLQEEQNTKTRAGVERERNKIAT